MSGRWKRLGVAVPVAAGIVGAGAALGTVTSAPLLVVYNPSPSMPVGWYVRVPLGPAVGRVVVIDPPPDARNLGWPADVRLLKPVAAAGGDHVCSTGLTNVWINGRPAAPLDPRPVPRWKGCRRLGPGELFLIAPLRDDSVDSRFYGPVTEADVVGTFAPLWTEDFPW